MHNTPLVTNIIPFLVEMQEQRLLQYEGMEGRYTYIVIISSIYTLIKCRLSIYNFASQRPSLAQGEPANFAVNAVRGQVCPSCSVP